ncbi:MAG: hypothetical protein MR890_00555, partial [Akkermansia muciniphila]|nr:hypothetical protein [Akkermansia muciniphila]
NMIAEGTVAELTNDRAHTEVLLHGAKSDLLDKIRTLAGEAWVEARPARNSLESVFIRGIRAKMREMEEKKGLR